MPNFYTDCSIRRLLLQALPETLPEGFNQIDILVNNAGFARGTAKATENVVADIEKMMVRIE